MKTILASNPPVTRRAFLKSSTAAAAALGTLDLSRHVHAAGSDIIKVGMIGCGGRNSGAVVQALTAGSRATMSCRFVDEWRFTKSSGASRRRVKWASSNVAAAGSAD